MFKDGWFHWMALLAQGDKPAAPATDPFVMFMPLIIIGVLFYFMLIRPQRREQTVRQDMLKTLKKHDKVVTIGGMLGSIANISPDGDTVTVKVDDNTKITFQRSAIQRVLRTDEGAEQTTSA